MSQLSINITIFEVMKIIVTLSFLFVSMLSFSQIDEILYGKEYATNKKNAFNGFIGESAVALFGVDYSYISKKKHDLIIRKYYKNDLSLVDSKNIYTNPIEDYYNKPLELFFIKSKFYLFSEFSNSKEGKTIIGLFIYNENGDETSFEIIDTVDQLERTDVEVRKSSDNSGFIVMQNHPHKVASRQVVEFKSINLRGEIVWQKELLSTNSIHKIKVEKLIHLKNETFILCNYGYKNYAQNSSSNENILSNKYTLWVYNRELDFMKEIVLRLKGKWINGVDISLNKQNELIVAGFVNSTRDFGIDASFSMLLNGKYEPKKVNYDKFVETDLLKFISEKDMDKVKYLEDFYLRDLVMQEDGSFFLLGEMYYKYVDRNYDPRTNITTTTDHYNYNSIIVSYFDRTGKLMWHEHVPKFQNTTNDFGYYSSFSWINLGNKIALIYNDNEKNLELSVTDYFNHKDLYNNRRNAHTYVIIDDKGVVKRSKLNDDKTNYILYPKQSFAVSKSSMYMMAEYGRHSKIISVSFK